MNRKNYLSAFVLIYGSLLFLMPSCSLRDKKADAEKEEIARFLADNPSLEFERKISGLYYYELEPGSGIQTKTHDTVFIKHTIMLLSGDTVYTNIDTPDTLKSAVNEGWLLNGLDEGLLYMREGGKSLLLLPSFLAYGNLGSSQVPGYTPLLIEVNLVKVMSYPFGK